MTPEIDGAFGREITHDQLTQWLEGHNWFVSSTGPGGQLWSLTSNKDAKIGVPYDPIDKFALDGIVRRLAHWHDIDIATLQESIALFTVDVARFIADVPLQDFGGKRGAQLSIVSHLFSGTGRIYRAAARSSRTSASNAQYTAFDEETYGFAVAGMTEVGSYALPIYVAVGTPDDDGTLGIAAPSRNRKLSSTVAKALKSIEDHIIAPAREDLSTEVIDHMSSQGVSKDLLSAVAELIAVEGADAKTTFNWATSHAHVPGADSLPSKVELPHDAKELIENATKKFKVEPLNPSTFAGEVRGIMLGDAPGQIKSVLAVPHKNQADNPTARVHGTIEVTHDNASEEFRDNLYRYMKSGQRIKVTGRVEVVSNRRHIFQPKSFTPIATQGTFDEA